MDNLLLKYMEESFLKTERTPGSPHPPLVTISREYGCPSKPIGQMLVEALNSGARKQHGHCWKFISKEILAESAKQLNIPEFQVRHMLDAEKKGLVLDLMTFSTTYGGNERIRKTVEKVIHGFAFQGYAVIVGRAGVAITREHPNALHFRLTAPLDWRVSEIAKQHGITEAQARQTAMETDARRSKFIENLLGRKLDPYVFDLSFNCKYLSKEEIVLSILRLMELKKMV